MHACLFLFFTYLQFAWQFKHQQLCGAVIVNIFILFFVIIFELKLYTI